jgi:hypothetical protein
VPHTGGHLTKRPQLLKQHEPAGSNQLALQRISPGKAPVGTGRELQNSSPFCFLFSHFGLATGRKIGIERTNCNFSKLAVPEDGWLQDLEVFCLE